MVNKRLSYRLEDMLLLRDDFGVPEEDRMDISIRSEDDVLHASEGVIDFCTAHGVDPRHTLYSGLCIEKMAGNIVQHGFKPEKKNSVDIRIVYKDGGILIRFKNTCRPFDPKRVCPAVHPG